MLEECVLVIGLPSDPCIISILRALRHQQVRCVLWNQRDLLNDCSLLTQDGIQEGILLVGDEFIELSSIVGVYNRPSEIEMTPEYARRDKEDPIVRHASMANWILRQWVELTPIPVMNRAIANESNGAKAFQAQLIRRYIRIPDSIVTNNIEHLLTFWKKHGRIIYKSCSGERSIVTELDEQTLKSRAPTLAFCPVLFQQYIEGTDIRVHVVGSEIFATAIRSKSTDYRYDSNTSWTAIDLPNQYAAACVSLTQSLGLELSGIDLRLTSSGDVYCFEVNPSPAFSVYEEATGQPISNAIAKHLIGS